MGDRRYRTRPREACSCLQCCTRTDYGGYWRTRRCRCSDGQMRRGTWHADTVCALRWQHRAWPGSAHHRATVPQRHAGKSRPLMSASLRYGQWSSNRANGGNNMQNKQPHEGFKGNKANLPSKPCNVCRREMTWRKAWAKNWADVKYCSEKCRRAATRQTRGAP